jgi:hypothetical protein
VTGVEPPTRRVVVHAGWPKTATTSLQTQLMSWPNLAGRPWARPGGELAKVLWRELLGPAPVDGARLDELFESSWIDRSRAVVLSDETIIATPRWQHDAARPTPTAVATRLTTSSWPMQMLFTLREPTGLLQSTYRHAVRGGYSRPYEVYLGWLENQMTRPTCPLAIREVVSAFEAVVGRDSITIAWMEDLVADPRRFWQDVAGAVDEPGLERLGVEPLEHRNESKLGPIRLELAVNRLLASHGDRRRSPVGRRFRRVYTQQVSRRLPAAGSLLRGAGSRQERALVARLDEDLEWLCDRYGVERRGAGAER